MLIGLADMEKGQGQLIADLVHLFLPERHGFSSRLFSFVEILLIFSLLMKTNAIQISFLERDRRDRHFDVNGLHLQELVSKYSSFHYVMPKSSWTGL